MGYLFQVQPLYIKGPEDPALAANGCYGGAGIYAATMIASVVYIKLFGDEEKEPELRARPARGPSYGST